MPKPYLVDSATGCWIWQRGVGSHGYGTTTVNGVPELAHRAYYMLYVGDIPSPLELDHTCRNHRCVNPAHLELVTRTENTRRGLGCRLTASQVESIRRRFARGERGRVLATEFGIAVGYVSTLASGRVWKDVPIYAREVARARLKGEGR
jgi:hypothetical protein